MLALPTFLMFHLQGPVPTTDILDHRSVSDDRIVRLDVFNLRLVQLETVRFRSGQYSRVRM